MENVRLTVFNYDTIYLPLPSTLNSKETMGAVRLGLLSLFHLERIHVERGQVCPRWHAGWCRATLSSLPLSLVLVMLVLFPFHGKKATLQFHNVLIMTVCLPISYCPLTLRY